MIEETRIKKKKKEVEKEWDLLKMDDILRENHEILRELALGNSVNVVATGKSMEPRIMEGSVVTINPFDHNVELKEGDMVFVRVNGKFLDHQILEITAEGEYVIGNMKRKIDGIVKKDAIYGIVHEAQRAAGN